MCHNTFFGRTTDPKVSSGLNLFMKIELKISYEYLFGHMLSVIALGGGLKDIFSGSRAFYNSSWQAIN